MHISGGGVLQNSLPAGVCSGLEKFGEHFYLCGSVLDLHKVS